MPISNWDQMPEDKFKDEYYKKLYLELNFSKGRLRMHGKGFYITVNGDVD